MTDQQIIHAVMYRDYKIGTLCNSAAWGPPMLFSAITDKVTCPGCRDKIDGGGTRPSILEAQNITPDCRSGRGLDGAWDEAVSRLREIYDIQVEHDPGVTLALAIHRGDFRVQA